jgi:hypothetical protein
MNEEELLEEEEQNQVIEPEIAFDYSDSNEVQNITTGGNFNAPFKSKIGNSTVDLSDKTNQDKMLEEYDTWWKHGLNMGIVAEDKKEERNKMRNDWYLKYHNMDYDTYLGEKQNEPKVSMYGSSNPIEILGDTIDGLRAPGMGAADFVMDAVGLMGEWGDELDDRWDAATKMDDPVHQQIRTLSSVIIPSLITGYGTASLIGKIPKMPALVKMLTTAGAWTLESQIVSGISDTSEDHSLSGALVQMWPGVFDVGGRLPLPEQFITYDEDSPEIRREKNRKEAAVLSFVSTIAGGALQMYRAKLMGKAAPEKMEWFIPKNEAAEQYKQTSMFKGTDENTLIKIQEIQTALSTKKLSKQNENVLINELLALEDDLRKFNTLDGYADESNIKLADEIEAAKRRKIKNPDQLELDLGIDPDLDPGLLDPASKTRQIPPRGNVARNMADTTAIKLGNSTGDPAPIITEAMREKGMMVGDKSRDVVMGIAESARMSGDFDAIVDGFRYDNQQMNSAAWGIFQDIISADNVEDVRNLFLSDRDVKNILFGTFKVDYVNEEQARGIAFAIKYLTDRFLGYDIATSSARVMDTLGREISTLAGAIQDFAPDWLDDDRVIGVILDKLNYLMNEYSLNKYIAGWSLRNKNWFNEIPAGDFDTVITRIIDEFTVAQNSIHAKNKKFLQTLKGLKQTMPEALEPMVDVFRATDGDVSDLAKLYKWTEQQVTPWGALKSPNPKEMNLFAKGLWANHMNFMLSGAAPINATVGNAYNIIIKPLTNTLGAIPWAIARRDVDAVKRQAYFFGAVFETNRRALKHAFKTMKQAHKDPTELLKAYKKDFKIQEDKVGNILRKMKTVYEKDNNVGMNFQIDLALGLNDIGRIPAARYGSTGLMFPDGYAADMMGTYSRRMQAYDEVLYEYGGLDIPDGPAKLLEAERRLAKSTFDSNDILQDPIAKALAGEVQLNLDDGVSRWINQAITAYPALRYQLTFPRTQVNWVKAAASWTPISLIPGMNRYAKTIYAKTDEQIAAALLEHGIDLTNTPNANVVFQQLQHEYTGRLMFTGLLFTSAYSYAMAGNIRGNGHYNQETRRKHRDLYGYQPKTVKIGDKWYSYEGIPGVEQTLAILGDMALYSHLLGQPVVEDIGGKLMWTLMASFGQNTPLTSIEPIIAILNADLSGFQRLAAQITRSFIPMSSALGVLSNAIDGAQKDIQGEYLEYLMNKFPVAKNFLPDSINPLGGGNNGVQEPDPNDPLQAINCAINPFAVCAQPGGDMSYKTQTGETVTFDETMDFLRMINYTGISRLNMDSTGSYKYETVERNKILSYMAERQPWQRIAEIMVLPETRRQIKEFRQYKDMHILGKNERIELKLKLLPFFRKIDKIVREEQKLAEDRYKIGEDNIIDQQRADFEMEQGNIQGAAQIEKQNLETQKLLQYNNN